MSAQGDESSALCYVLWFASCPFVYSFICSSDSCPYDDRVRKGTESSGVESWIEPHRQVEATIRSWFGPQECSRKRSQHLTGRAGIVEVEVRDDGINKDDINTGPHVIFSV